MDVSNRGWCCLFLILQNLAFTERPISTGIPRCPCLTPSCPGAGMTLTCISLDAQIDEPLFMSVAGYEKAYQFRGGYSIHIMDEGARLEDWMVPAGYYCIGAIRQGRAPTDP